MRGTPTLLLVLLVVPTATAAPWLQFGHDAARTGVTVDPGPESFDVAFLVTLNATRPLGAPPLVVGREVLVLATNGTASAVRAIGLDTARVEERVVVEDGPATALASDGERLFVARTSDVAAYPLAGGAVAWATPFPVVMPGVAHWTACVEPAVRDAVVFVACTTYEGSRADPSSPLLSVRPRSFGPSVAFVVALDAATGAARWTWTADDAVHASGPLDVGEGPGGTPSAVLGLAVVGDVVTALLRQQAAASDAPVADSVWALDVETGAPRWVVRDRETHANALAAAPRSGRLSTGAPVDGWSPGVPTGTPDVVFVKFRSWLEAVSTSTGDPLWREDLAGDGPYGGSALAYLGGSVLATSHASLFRVDAATRVVMWETSLPAQGDDFQAARGIVVAGGHAYVRSWNGFLSVIDVDDGSIAWRTSDGTPRSGFGLGVAVAERVAVLATSTGVVTVVGRTGASLLPDVRLTSAYPAVGTEVVADLSGTVAGAQGPATEYRADWGDGSVTEWQPSPRLAHAYGAAGDHPVTFSARNAAGQTASVDVLLHVGGAPVTTLERAFASENQERTFFLLGLLVTLAGAGVAGWRVRRRRTRLAREIAAMDEVYARTKDTPATCEAALAAARARAHALLAHGTLEEGQVAVLVRHADELSGRLRLGLVEERFGYLTVALARRLRAILEDGRVTAHERAQFLDAIAAEPSLTDEQRAEVRRTVEDWGSDDAR